MATSRVNLTDSDQSNVESSEFDSGIPVFTDSKTRVIASSGGGSAGVSHASGSRASNAGVIMDSGDAYSRFSENLTGKG